MLSYLDKFNNLEPDLREQVSSDAALAAMEELEQKYGVSLAGVVMRVMVKEISIVDLPKYFVFEFGINGRTAEELTEELKTKVFLGVADYLGFAISEAGVAASEGKYDAWLNNKRGEADVQGSSFFFSPEDEEEVRELAKKVEAFTPTPGQVQKIADDNEQKIDQICRQLKISFSSTELNSRFRKIMSTYIKGVRNKVDVKQTLIKAIDAGGLSMDPIYVDNILLVADKVNESFISVPPAVATAPKADDYSKLTQSGARDIDYDFSRLAKPAPVNVPAPATATATESVPLQFVDDNKVAAIDGAEDAKKAESGNEVIDLTKLDNTEPDLTNQPDLPKTLSADTIERSAATDGLKPARMSAPINIATARRAALTDDRMKLEDVRYKPKLTGPVDELGEMDAVNFRRLNSDPIVAAGKIKQKISNLEEESYARRLAGIKSWRQSPINKLYLAIGQASILNKKGVPAVIEEMTNSGQDYLTTEEFNAVMNLNKELKY